MPATDGSMTTSNDRVTVFGATAVPTLATDSSSRLGDSRVTVMVAVPALWAVAVRSEPTPVADGTFSTLTTLGLLEVTVGP